MELGFGSLSAPPSIAWIFDTTLATPPLRIYVEGSGFNSIIDLCMLHEIVRSNQVAEYVGRCNFSLVSKQMPLPINIKTNAFTDREPFYSLEKPRCFIARRDADFVCEMHTALDAKNLRATSLPRLLGCLVACGAARILSDPPAQVDTRTQLVLG